MAIGRRRPGAPAPSLGDVARPTTTMLIADRNRLGAEALMDAFLEVAAVDCTIATSLAKALLAAQLKQPELVLVDAWIARSDVEHVVRQLKECAPRSKVFVMASDVDAGFQRRALRGGAHSCHEKDKVPAAAQGMLEAVRAA